MKFRNYNDPECSANNARRYKRRLKNERLCADMKSLNYKAQNIRCAAWTGISGDSKTRSYATTWNLVIKKKKKKQKKKNRNISFSKLEVTRHDEKCHELGPYLIGDFVYLAGFSCVRMRSRDIAITCFRVYARLNGAREYVRLCHERTPRCNFRTRATALSPFPEILPFFFFPFSLSFFLPTFFLLFFPYFLLFHTRWRISFLARRFLPRVFERTFPRASAAQTATEANFHGLGTFAGYQPFKVFRELCRGWLMIVAVTRLIRLPVRNLRPINCYCARPYPCRSVFTLFSQSLAIYCSQPRVSNVGSL